MLEITNSKNIKPVFGLSKFRSDKDPEQEKFTKDGDKE